MGGKHHTRRSQINRKYKDTLFARLFGSIENKGAMIDLYNELNDSRYPHNTNLEIVTIRNTVYLGMHNDAAFIIDNEILSLWEEQSTYNPNMPLRGLIYLVQEYQRMFADGKKDIYGPRKIILPTPKYVVFYAGKPDEPNEVMKLSDAFTDPKGGCAEMLTRVLNISNPENGHILDACHLLKEYTELIRIVRANIYSGMSTDEAVEAAVQECIDRNILKNYLLENREEATDMILTEYNEKQHYENVANYYREEGEAIGEKRGERRGEKQGNLRMLYDLASSGDLPIEKAVVKAKTFGVKNEQDFRNRARLAGFDLSHIE